MASFHIFNLFSFTHVSTKYVFFSLVLSLDIFDPSEYARLKSGEIGANVDVINVQPTAHPTPLHESPYFSNATNYKLSFSDGLNEIAIYPRNRVVAVRHHQNVSFAIPNNYMEYEYSLESQSILSDDEIDFLATCKEATSYHFQDMGDVLIRFKHRIVEWKNLKNLQFIRMSVSKQFLWSTSISPFLRFMPALKMASFVFQDIPSRKIEKFVSKQYIPNGWKRHGSIRNVVTFHKNGKKRFSSVCCTATDFNLILRFNYFFNFRIKTVDLVKKNLVDAPRLLEFLWIGKVTLQRQI